MNKSDGDRIGVGSTGSIHVYGSAAKKVVSLYNSSWIRETVFVRALSHPNIIRFTNVEIDKVKKQVLMVMPLYPRTLICRCYDPLQTITQLLSAVCACHAAAVLHRDIKEDNILVDEHGDIALCDFGSAQIMGDEYQSRTVGTISHRPPEIQRALVYDERIAYDGRIDVWSACIVALNICSKVTFFKYVRRRRRELNANQLRGLPTHRDEEQTYGRLLTSKWLYVILGEFMSKYLRHGIDPRLVSVIKQGLRPYAERPSAAELLKILSPEMCEPDTIVRSIGSDDGDGGNRYRFFPLSHQHMLRNMWTFHKSVGSHDSVYSLFCRIWLHLPEDLECTAIAAYCLAQRLLVDHYCLYSTVRAFWGQSCPKKFDLILEQSKLVLELPPHIYSNGSLCSD